MHRRQPIPITRPTVHVLLVTRLQILNATQFPLVEELLNKKKLTTVDHRLHHHIGQAGRFTELTNLAALFHRRGHRHGAGDVFAGLERGN